MRLCTLFLLVSLGASSLALTLERETCDATRMMVDVDVADADALINGLFEMRLRGSNGYGCGSPNLEFMLAYEAARWSLQRINQNNFVPGVKLGMRAYDTCLSPNHALAAVNNFYPQYSTGSMYCNETEKINLGVLGVTTSWTTRPVAEMTSNFPASMISSVATSPELSDKSQYPYFMRTVSSGTEQILAMIAMMERLSWERILIVYSDNDYGTDSMREFVRLSQDKNVCVVEAVAIPGVPDLTKYIEKLQHIGTYDVNGAVFFGGHVTMLKMMDAVQNAPDPDGSISQIQWIVSYTNLNDIFLSPRMKGTIFVQPEFTEVSEFFDYFTQSIDENSPPVENPWYQDWFMKTFQCRLSGINYAPYNTYSACTSKSPTQKRAAANTRYAYIDSTIRAVFAYAKALKTAQAAKCTINNFVSGVCSNLKRMSPTEFNSYLKNVDFNFNEVGINSLQGKSVGFDANGDSQSDGFMFWNYNNQPSGSFSFKMVGKYANKVLDVDVNKVFMYSGNRSTLLPSLPSSVCPENSCKNCLVPRLNVNFDFTPGDVVIAGLFDIHAQGSEVLTCGHLKASHALNAAAFKYAINTAQQQFPGILNGISLGSLIIDLCDNAEIGRMLLNNVLGGRMIVSDMHGQVVDPNQIEGVVGELDSTEAISMAAMLGAYQMPYIESSATSTYLSMRSLFPTFNRAIPSDYHQMVAIVLMLNRMNWKYVQIVHSADAYGQSGYKTVKDEGASSSICIAAVHEIGNDNDFTTIANNLKNKPEARVVIAIVDSGDYRSLLQAFKNQNMQGQFLLVGTETWGRRASIVAGLESVAEGSISIDVVAPPLMRLRNWLDSLNPADASVVREMPFFIEWYQYAFNCYLDATKRGVYEDECVIGRKISTAPNYSESTYTPFTISATYVVAKALHETLIAYCGVNYDGVCWQFRSDPGVKASMLSSIRDNKILLDNMQLTMEDGEGKTSYKFYSYTNGGYQEFATYLTATKELQSFQQTPLSIPQNFQSQCFGFCSECVYLLQTDPFTLIPGPQLKIGVNIGAHYPDGNDPFLCKSLRLTNGLQSALAIYFALEQVNEGTAPVSLNDVHLGALIFDHCNSAARANGLPSALYSGLLEARNTVENKPNLNTVRAWITDNTLVTEQMKDLFSNLNLPVISPMASSNMFLNEEEYPTFVRTIQGDSTIATALAVLAKSLGLQYVSVLHSANSFGREGMQTFGSIAQQEGICILKKIEVGSDSMANITAMLLGQSTHAVVTYLGQDDMDAFLEARGSNVNGDKLVVMSPEPYPLIYYKRGMAAKNLLSLRMKTNGLDGFRQFVADFTYETVTEHPYLAEYYQDIFQCNLPGHYRYNSLCSPLSITNSPNFHVDNYILPFINAVYTFVAAAHETLKIQCGETYSGVCTKFYSDPNTNTILYNHLTETGYVDESGSRFQYIGKEGNTGREIVLFDGQQIKKVADFAGASINFDDSGFPTSFENVMSTCILPCTQCINNNMNFTYIPGDILLGGIFDVHEASLTPFQCGNIKTLTGFQLLEAFHFALNKVNDKTGSFGNILKHIKLGGIGLDACESSVRGGYMVSNIHNGLSDLQRDGVTINTDSIDAYLGSHSSGRSLYLARLLKSLKMPQVSYGSTSVDLLDEDRYPYFLRTVPADDRQAQAMLDFLRKYNIRYVQVVHSGDNYGEQGARIFSKLAVDEKVCVAQTIAFPDKAVVTTESANDVVLELLQKPIANTVVVFADASFINELLKAVRRNPEAMNKFKFIGSDSWANNVKSTEGVEDIALGSVTLDLDVVDLREFDEYLGTKTPANYPENPWFPEYYEEIQNCYLTIPDPRYPERCQANPKNIVTSQRYKQDTVIIHVINAVFASARGIDAALKEICGNDYTNVCEAFKNMDGRSDLILKKIQEAKFTDLSGQEFSFSERGDGNKGYVLYSIDTSNVFGYVYNPIGKYSSEGNLQMNSGYSPSWDGSCERQDSCTECPTVRNLQTRYMLPDYNNNDNPATLVVLSGIHRQGNDEYRCGEMHVGNFLDALSMLYTIQYSGLVPNNQFNLRTLILDHCYNPLRIDQDLFNLMSTGTLCNTGFNSGDTVINSSSIVGALVRSSANVVAANRVLAPMKVQLLSHTASSTAFSDQWRYPYFARTVPPDNVQMEVVAKILKENDWKYVSVLYSSGSYGVNGYRVLRDLVNDKMYSCIGFAEPVVPFGEMEDYRAAVRRMAEVDGISVLVLITVSPRPILEAIIEEGLADRFLVIGTDSWGDDKAVLQGIWRHFLGAITISFRNAFYTDFTTWLSELSYTNRKGIPNDWFVEFYQHLHECYLPDEEVKITKFTRACGLNEPVTTEMVEKYGTTYLGLTSIAAAYAAGNSLDDFHRKYACAGISFSECMARVEKSREVLFNMTLDQTWKIPKTKLKPADDYDLELGDDRYWNIGYTIYNVQSNNEYVIVGSQTVDGFTFNEDDFKSNKADLVSKCPVDQYCDCNVEVTSEAIKQTAPKYMRDHEPRNYFYYDENTGEKIYNWPIWAIAVGVLTSIGLLVGLLLFFYFLIFYPIRGGTTVLGFMTMIGLFGIYAVNFAFFLPASEDTCGIREFFMGVVYSIVFAALLVKAVDNWRFKDTEYSTKRYTGIANPCTLVLITLGIILIQCVIPIEWLILRPPSASMMDDSSQLHDWMWCDPHDMYDISLILSMVFVIFLVVLTAIFSALAWDSESNYYESRWIFVSCVCTAGCFLVWMVVSTNAGPPYRDPAVALGNFVNATALLIFIPLRKLVLLLQFSSEEEKAKGLPMDDPNQDVYSTVYTNPEFQADVFQADYKPASENGY